MVVVKQNVRIRRLGAVVSAGPYRPVLTHAVLRRVLPGIAVSALGDGMAVVAVSWLALHLGTGPGQGLWVAAAAAVYTLPGALGAVTLSRVLSGLPGLRLAGLDATLRMLTLGAIASSGASTSGCTSPSSGPHQCCTLGEGPAATASSPKFCPVATRCRATPCYPRWAHWGP